MTHVKSKDADIVVRHPSPGYPMTPFGWAAGRFLLFPSMEFGTFRLSRRHQSHFVLRVFEIVRHKGGA